MKSGWDDCSRARLNMHPDYMRIHKGSGNLDDDNIFDFPSANL